MLAGIPPTDDSWEPSGDGSSTTYTGPHGSVTISRDPVRFEFRDTSGRSLTRTWNLADAFRSELHHKDLGIALAVGREYGVVLPVTTEVCRMFESLMARGRGSGDHSALLTFIEDLSEHEGD